MGHSFTSFCSGIPRNNLNDVIILSLGMESFGSDGVALSHESAMPLHGGVHDPFVYGSRAVVVLLEGFTYNLVSKGVC